MTIRTAIIGYGKIGHDEHRPAIDANDHFRLIAVAGGRRAVPHGVQSFDDHHAMLAALAGQLDAVAICTPPAPRHAIARDCLAAGLDVLLEKPPAATLGAIDDLVATAERLGRTLYAAWHSQHAPAVIPAREALAGQRVRAIEIVWAEDVRRWHFGQDWVLGPGGFGVLDAGINALSIASCVLPEPLMIGEATLMTPAGRGSPIAASITFVGSDRTASFDWRATETERRAIAIRTEKGLELIIADGGMSLALDGTDQRLERRGEYPPIYARFADLIANRRIEADIAPLRLVADISLIAARQAVEPFDWG
jgi:predicted dehydrogenase